MMRRDAHGRYRKATAEERWPNPVERARFMRIIEYFNASQEAFWCLSREARRDLSFLSREVWP